MKQDAERLTGLLRTGVALPWEQPRFLPGPRLRLRRARFRLGRRLGDLLFERGLDTAHDAFSIDHFDPERVWYEASGWSWLPRALRRRDVTPDDVFLDFGSGKGRVLLQAARYCFGRAIGVELDPALVETARSNIARRRPRLACPRIDLVVADAAEYRVPDDVTVVYLHHPFAGETFRTVLRNLIDSLDRNPRRLRIIYVLAPMEEDILRSGRFRHTRSVKISYGGIPRRIALYDSVPGAR